MYSTSQKKVSNRRVLFYGDTLSMYSSTRTTLLCYGSRIEHTSQYVSTLTTRNSVAMITCTWCEMYVILSKLLVLVFAQQKRPNSITRTTGMCSMFTCTSLIRTHSYGLPLRFYAKIINYTERRETFSDWYCT